MRYRHHWCLVVIFSAGVSTATADWFKLSMTPDQQEEFEIDMESVKQSGPMAIYRRVQVRSRHTKQGHGDSSMATIYEYDCMNSKMRHLMHADPAWQDLPDNPLGQETFQLICPRGDD